MPKPNLDNLDKDLIRLLEKLPEAQAFDARRTLARILLKEHPEKMEVLFGNFAGYSAVEARNATRALFDQIRNIKKTEINRLTRGDMLHMLQSKSGQTEEADQLSDRVAIIDQGKIVALDYPEQLKKNYPLGGNLNLEDVFVHLTGRHLGRGSDGI